MASDLTVDQHKGGARDLRPFRCPVCNGAGKCADWGGHWGTTSTGPMTRTCHSCSGTGVVWGPPEKGGE